MQRTALALPHCLSCLSSAPEELIPHAAPHPPGSSSPHQVDAQARDAAADAVSEAGSRPSSVLKAASMPIPATLPQPGAKSKGARRHGRRPGPTAVAEDDRAFIQDCYACMDMTHEGM